MDKALFLTDIHCGFEWKADGVSRTIQPTHSSASIATAIEFARDFRPNILVLMGDQLNFSPISHWNNETPGDVEGMTIQREVEVWWDEVWGPLMRRKYDRIIVHLGNHERWLDDLIARHPGLRGSLDVVEMLVGRKRDKVELYGYGAASKVGDYQIVHGDRIPNGVMTARSAAIRYPATNLLYGHFHTDQSYTSFGSGEGERYFYQCIPCLSTRSFNYGRGGPNTFVNGWGWGYIDTYGRLHPSVATIRDGVAVVDRREYVG